jgi:hypothetical protein
MHHLGISRGLLLFGIVVFGGVETAFADVQYSFTPISGAITTIPSRDQ